MSIFPLRLIPKGTNFNFMGFKSCSYFISSFLVIASLLTILIKQFNYGIDFAGGINIEIRTNVKPDITKMREVLGDLEIGEVVIQNFGQENDLSIKVGVSSEDDLMQYIELIKGALASSFDYEIDYRKVDFVGPQVGSQMIKLGLNAMILSFLSIMIYVWIRFEWQFSFGVIIALLHDVILGLGLMSVARYDFNLSTVAAILTIIGYSVNNSVVIYDRIRDNLRKYSIRPIDEIINLSVNETLSRTTITALTTLLANLSLIILGGEAIRSFSVLVFFGILVGTFSSIFLSAPLLTSFNLKHTKI